MTHPKYATHPVSSASDLPSTPDAAGPEDARQPVTTSLDLPAGIEYLHLPDACLEALFEGNQDLSRRRDLAYGLQLAVYEICANIVMHGYQICEGNAGDPESCRIRVVFTVAQQPLRLVIDLYDRGRSFDITQVPEPDIAEPQARGYGLYLIRQLVDEAVYEVQQDDVLAERRSGEQYNHWRLTKFL